ncbi:EM14S01-3B_G0047940.mRNA.1.CDS.1 [Saccharomyces cerevisiae]|nr:EM14S01-3B_G0047940.mRNA.1.CDS.1 [Saccharomyces cerevisiae]
MPIIGCPCAFEEPFSVPVKEKFLILVHILPKQASVLSVGTLNALISTTASLICVPFS